jgi:hypothetical protein
MGSHRERALSEMSCVYPRPGRPLGRHGARPSYCTLPPRPHPPQAAGYPESPRLGRGAACMVSPAPGATCHYWESDDSLSAGPRRVCARKGPRKGPPPLPWKRAGGSPRTAEQTVCRANKAQEQVTFFGMSLELPRTTIKRTLIQIQRALAL